MMNRNKPQLDTIITISKASGATADGCGLVSNHFSSQWILLTESENDDVVKLQECLKIIARIFRGLG
jgi:hypothetical protein